MLATVRRFAFAISLSFTLTIAHVAVAQPMLINPASLTTPVESPAPAPAAAAPAPAPSMADKRTENAEQLRVAMRKLEANGANDAAAAQDVAYFQTREAILAQQDAVEQQIKDLEARRAELDAFVKSPSAQNKEYKFADLDRMRDDLAAETARASLAADKLKTAKTNLQKAQAAFEQAEDKRRLAQDAFNKDKEAKNASELSAAADHAQHDALLAGEVLALRKRELEREELSQQVVSLLVTMRTNFVARITPQVKFAEADYQEQLDGIKKKEDSENMLLTQARANLRSADADLASAKQLLDAGNGDRATLIEVMAAKRRAQEKLSEEIESRTRRLQQFAQLRDAWRYRYELATANKENTSDEVWAQLKSVQKETKEILEQLSNDSRVQIMKMRDARSTLSSANKKAESADKATPEVKMAIDAQKSSVEETLKLYEKNLVTIDDCRRVNEKLLDEIGATVEEITPKAIAMGVWFQVTQVWEHKLGSINGQPIQVGMAVKGLAILLVGWMLSRTTAGFFANRLLKRFRLSKDATSAIRSLVFYSMLLFVALTALDTINVPLTAFTILGGALAIGVGFGSQTLINNFIGGLIMLAERPVRLGERITFKDVDGVVEDVGFRCTKLRTPTDHLVTIPNSTLVNESIENIDRRRTIRRNFTIAVTYNLSPELLAEGVQAIRDILEERGIREKIHPIVGFEELTPRVHFTDFAAESLNIQISYWYAPVESTAFAAHTERVNLRIMEEFDRLGIDFAFPSKTPYVQNAKRGNGHTRGKDSYAA
jgi:small-conductance mechanosensitive channel